MNKLFYFSKSNLQYVELRNFRSKLMIFSVLIIFLMSLSALGGYFVLSSLFNPGSSYSHINNENVVLKEKLDEITLQYARLNKELDKLVKVNGDLRTAANLSPVSNEEMKVGVGGGYFDNNVDFSSGYIDSRLKKTLSLVDVISRKVDFEKANYLEISSKIKENRQLFDAIPAIKPCSGTLIENSFGMRIHPILKILKMHEGVDIITNMGTSVFATGKGIVDFVGIKGGYGLCIEINHGFGYSTMYGHLSEVEVAVGQKIDRGTQIARSGNSGLSSGPHLHYEVSHNGIKLNPIEFFFDDMSFFASSNKK